MVKFNVYILMKSNIIIKKKINNPSNKFKLSYNVDGEYTESSFQFSKSCVYFMKGLLFTKRIIFYEHGNLHPLNPKFVTKETTLKQVSDILSTGLLAKLSDSTKNKAMAFTTWTILGIVGIIGLVLIVVFG